MKIVLINACLGFTLLAMAGASEPKLQVVSPEIQKEYQALAADKKKLIRNYLNTIALYNLYQEEQENVRSGNIGMVVVGQDTTSAVAQQFTLGANIPELKKALAQNELDSLVNRIELATIKNKLAGTAAYAALFQDLGMPIPAAFNQAIRDQNKDIVTLIFEGKNPAENKKIQDALDIRFLTPEKYKIINLPHNFVILAKRANGKWASAEHIIGQKQFNDILKPNTEITIKQQPHDMEFAPVNELRVVLVGKQAQFKVLPNKKYIVTYSPCPAAGSNVEFAQKPETFCIREESDGHDDATAASKFKQAVAAASTEKK